MEKRSPLRNNSFFDSILVWQMLRFLTYEDFHLPYARRSIPIFHD